MQGDNYYLITALPALGEWGSPIPLHPREMLEHVEHSRSAGELLKTIFLSDDLLQWQGCLAGQTEEVDPIVLTKPQLQDEEPLPDYLQPKGDQSPSGKVPIDLTWEAYFRHAYSIAQTSHCPFLMKWVAYEVGLRNAMAEARAKALQLDPENYLVATDLSAQEEDFSSLVSEWTAASDPLTGLAVLDRKRWEWLGDHDRWFSFQDDELAAYAAKLMILQRWHRLEEKKRSSQETAGINKN